jgi:hypothetical protein
MGVRQGDRIKKFGPNIFSCTLTVHKRKELSMENDNPVNLAITVPPLKSAVDLAGESENSQF